MADSQRTVVVTGASQGIGRNIAMTLAATGWHVIAVSRNEFALQETVADIIRAVGNAEVRTTDVSDEAAVAALAEGLSARGVVPDAVVNNSGIGGPHSLYGKSACRSGRRHSPSTLSVLS